MGIETGERQNESKVIAQDWEWRPLSDIVDIVSGKPYEQQVKPDGPYVLLTMDSIGLDGKFKQEQKALRFFDGSLIRGDIVAVLDDIAHGKLLGLCDVVPADNIYVLNQRMARLRAKRALNPNFVRMQINARQSHFQKRGQGTSQRHIYKRDFDDLVIPLPTRIEQDAIAEALVDADSYIESLEQLLAKKRDIRQGMMQELLTGERRLPGFNNAWSLQPLGLLADVIMGQSPISSHYNTQGFGLPLIQGNADIKNRETIKRVFTTEIGKKGKAGDILMSVRAPVGEISRTIFDVCLGRGVCAIRYRNNFLYHALIAKESVWVSISKGSTFDSVTSHDVKTLMIDVPNDEKEQIAIATILQDMDAELNELQKRITKARDIKQGMMQNLLTGRIRLV